ncbi:MAG: hypothetical protein QM692_05590 [Thermomicrobiales bacterium]
MLREAQAAGLLIQAEGDRLLVRGPKRLQEVALEVLRHKPEILTLLAMERDEIAWRAARMQGQVLPGKPIPVLVARACPVGAGQCVSCGEDMAPGERVRCRWCVTAAQQVLGWHETRRTP